MWSTAVHITQQRPGPVLPNPVDTSITASHVMAYYSDTNTGNTSVLLALQLTLAWAGAVKIKRSLHFVYVSLGLVSNDCVTIHEYEHNLTLEYAHSLINCP